MAAAAVHQRSVTKHGNRRLRAALVELAWLVCRYQPDYRRCAMGAALAGRDRSAKKKAVVAIARRLAVDLCGWRPAGDRRALACGC